MNIQILIHMIKNFVQSGKLERHGHSNSDNYFP